MEEKKYLNETKWVILIISTLLTGTMIFLAFTRKGVIKKENVLTIEYKAVYHPNEIEDIDSSGIKPIVYDCHTDFDNLQSDYRKKKFIALILPAILVTKYELKKENTRATQIWSRMKNKLPVSKKDSQFVMGLTEKYQTNSLYEILKKQQVHPTSIIIAQAALESGWGTSRFFNEGNNLFGIWSYNSGDPRVNSLINRNGKSIYVRKYISVKACIEDYFLTIANSWAYSDFRRERLEVKDPLALIWYLSQYSELRYDYVKKIGQLMLQNDLEQYDDYALAKKYMVELNVE